MGLYKSDKSVRIIHLICDNHHKDSYYYNAPGKYILRLKVGDPISRHHKGNCDANHRELRVLSDELYDSWSLEALGHTNNRDFENL